MGLPVLCHAAHHGTLCEVMDARTENYYCNVPILWIKSIVRNVEY